MPQGGYRPGSGRKKGSLASHTIKTQEFRKQLIDETTKEQEPIIRALVSSAKKGNLPAIKELLDRILGKANQELDVKSDAVNIYIWGGYDDTPSAQMSKKLKEKYKNKDEIDENE